MPSKRNTFAAVAAVGLTVAGCGASDAKSHDDASSYAVDRSAAAVIAMPNDFGNVAHKCDGHGHRVYTTTNTNGRPSSLYVITDPACGR